MEFRKMLMITLYAEQKTVYILSICAQAHIPKFLKPSLENVKGRYNQVTAMIHNQKAQLVIHCNLHQWVP